MEGNPIKYSDLIQPDDSIEKAIRQLNELSDAFTFLFNIVQRDAKKALDELKDVNENTAEGQLKAQALATASDKLAQAYRNMTIAQSATGQKIVEFNEAAKEQIEIDKDMIAISKSVETTYNRLSAQYSKNKRELNAMTKEERLNTKAGQDLTKETQQLRQEMKEWDDSIKATSKSMEKAEKSTASFRERLTAIATHPVVLTLVAIVAAFKGLKDALTSTLEGQELYNEAVAYGQAIFMALFELLAKVTLVLAKQVIPWIKIFATDFMNMVQQVQRGMLYLERGWAQLWGKTDKSDALTKRMEELDESIEKSRKKVQELREEQKETAKDWANDWKEVVDMYDNLGNKIMENQDNLSEANKLRMQYLAEEKSLIVENAKTEVELERLHAESERFRRADAEKGIKFLQASYDLREKIANNDARLARIAYEAAALEATAHEDSYQLQLAEAKALEALLQAEAKIGVVRRERFRQSNRFHTQALAQARARIASTRRERAAEAGEQRREDEKSLSEFTFALDEREKAAKRFKENQKKLAKETYMDEFADLYSRVNWDEEEGKDTDDGTLSRADFRLMVMEKIAILRDEDLAAEFEYSQTLRDLWIEHHEEMMALQERIMEDQIEMSEFVFDLEEMQIERSKKSDATKHRMTLQAQKKMYAAQLESMTEYYKVSNPYEVEKLKELLKLMDYQIQQARKDESLLDLLGLSIDDDTKEGLTSAFDFALGQMQAFLDAKIKMAEQAVKATEEEMSATQKMLDYELTARANGYASNVEQARKERALAEEQNRAAIAEKKKLQKAQEKIQTAQQTSSLITASALIWSQLGNPAISIPAIAVMWGSFAAAKIQAAKATKGAEQYGDGHVELLRGGSHFSGNDIDLGVKADGTRRRAEGGEYFAVINRKSSKRFGGEIPGIINSLNDGSFPEKYANVFSGGGSLMLTQSQTSIDLERIEGDLREIRDNSGRRKYVDSKGNMIEEYKNLRRVTRHEI